MKVLIQRVLNASVTVENQVIGSINKGYLLYVCFEKEDKLEIVKTAISKIVSLRIFEDSKGLMNKSIKDVNAQVLSISQFTLSWDGRKGHRPSFDRSMQPNEAKVFYKKFNDELEQTGIEVQKGRFGADMKVSSINDGPVTFFLNF